VLCSLSFIVMTAKKTLVVVIKFYSYLIKVFTIKCILFVNIHILDVTFKLCPRGLHVEIILRRGSAELVRQCKSFIQLMRQC
jgi:hypothetical protein